VILRQTDKTVILRWIC